MIFLGNTFCSGRYSLLPPTFNIANITAIQISSGKYSRLYLSANSELGIDAMDAEWDNDTLINADYAYSISAGNSGFSLKNTDHLVIKRRELGTYDWIVIYVKEIHTLEDFNIVFEDKYARAGTDYEYCVSSYLNGVENCYVIENVFSDFSGFYITDKDCLFGTIYDVDGCDTSQNIVAQTLQLLNSKYMTVVTNSCASGESGSITGSFFKQDETCVGIVNRNLQYRNNFKNRLANRKPLILKVYDGRIWIIRVVGTPTDSKNEHVDIRQISFDWVEVGDINDMESLYRNGFSDVGAEWW